MQIGDLKLANPVVTAPMAGVTDLPFRLLLKEQGCGLVCGEMVSAQALVYGNRNTLRLLATDPRERPVSIQLFGADPETMARAAGILATYPVDVIDINMGCPVPKVVRNGEGAALLNDLPRAARIVRAVVAAVDCPVTVKMRRGWAPGAEVAPELAVLCAEAGAAAVTVHGRFRAQFYSGEADWDVIRRAKAAVKIPVIGNGDIFTAADALRMRAATGCDGVMVGRGLLGNPWLVRETVAALNGAPNPPPPTMDERFALIRRHLAAQVEFCGEERGVKEMRKHLAWYLKGFPGAARARQRINETVGLDELYALLDVYEEDLKKYFHGNLPEISPSSS
ncbi:MAG: tRNA dihydrouridine synthase DusB [Firmicutes bacterium]|nr:tRNA dihydrouridine synthase DusB [Bacillota bacterium]